MLKIIPNKHELDDLGLKRHWDHIKPSELKKRKDVKGILVLCGIQAWAVVGDMRIPVKTKRGTPFVMRVDELIKKGIVEA